MRIFHTNSAYSKSKQCEKERENSQKKKIQKQIRENKKWIKFDYFKANRKKNGKCQKRTWGKNGLACSKQQKMWEKKRLMLEKKVRIGITNV